MVTVAKWVTANIESLGGDRSRMVIAGDSAGGALSAVLANELPGSFVLQVLLYPMTDLTMSHPSVEENGDGYMLTRDAIEWCVDHYLGGGADARDPRVSPLMADDAVLAAAPPAVVITAELDPLRDEGEAYAERLIAAGVHVEHKRYDGMIHGFYTMGGMVPAAAAEALAQVVAAIRRATT
jgi:acetyl esterase